jgi:fructokinase
MLTVIGEAIVDLVEDRDGRYTAHPGGSPLNVAIGLARLGHQTRIGARFARTRMGRVLRDHAVRNGVDVSCAVDAEEPASLAVVTLDAVGSAKYDFYLAGTADWQWSPAELVPLVAGTTVLHAGSLASFLDPGAIAIAAAMSNARQAGAVVSFDPNVRPRIVGPADRARERVEALAAHTHLIKASAEDLAWLYPGESVEVVARRWLSLGPRLVSVTLGAEGAIAAFGDTIVRRSAPVVAVVDTVGAGDAFTAGMLSALADGGPSIVDSLDTLSTDRVAAVIDVAIRAAAITCTRAGADPPTSAELMG